ncbi:MAG: hypothetical protein U9P70_04990 [Patescibacteria group bacterium]|nr:hypothetical protein [Patescibacteria group bacterium]
MEVKIPKIPVAYVCNEWNEMQWMPTGDYVRHIVKHKRPGSKPDPDCPFCRAEFKEI